MPGGPPGERKVEKVELHYLMPRGPVTGPLQCDGGYRKLVLRPALRPTGSTPRNSSGVIIGGTVGMVGKQGLDKAEQESTKFQWLDAPAVDRIFEALREKKFPIFADEGFDLLASSNAENALPVWKPTKTASSGGTRVPLKVDLTDPAVASGYYKLVFSAAAWQPGMPRKDWIFVGFEIEYHMPRGPAAGRYKAEGGYRVFVLQRDDPAVKL